MFWNRFDFFKDFLTINWPPLSTSNFSMRSYKPVLLLMNLNVMPNYKSSNSQVQWAECHWDKLASSLPSLPRPAQRRLQPECWRCPSRRQRSRRLGQPPDLSSLSVRTQLQGTWIWGEYFERYTPLQWLKLSRYLAMVMDCASMVPLYLIVGSWPHGSFPFTEANCSPVSLWSVYRT